MISNIHRNIMGTISFDAKFDGMRKAQDFIVYPMKENATEAVIQSDTRIGRVDLASGVVVLSKPRKGGAGFAQLMLGYVPGGQLSQDDLNNLKASIRDTAGARVGTHGVVSDNSAAATVFGKVPE
jgi:hypothetical protein